MNGQSGEPLEDAHPECATLRERLREAKDRLSDSLPASPSYPFTPEPTPPDHSAPPPLDQAIGAAASAAMRLMETALAEHIRAVSMEKELQREIDHRLRVEKALMESEQRCRRILDTIGEVRWISTTDWETILDIDPKDRPPPP
ncbi:hypothetical protein ThidrDRAFT_1001 [Thiorhodococcus drewsii AZ1]|uniref:Uncharacterized protein n=1 Tax=Thiorhodococcus drewsii AZ1 TaxID=765913 RepID=G2DY89_9GAMM|nr:hypothetical protein [Thiorhodococcus drewsii]EGV32881.1 hypothetical protein ThidrDRAFT_1001 [Thiorhodococcus drewsii AZ1]